MDKIKYEDDGLHRVLTKCPHGKRNGVHTICVSTPACIRCEHFVEVDRKNREITCSLNCDMMDVERDRFEDAFCSAQGED